MIYSSNASTFLCVIMSDQLYYFGSCRALSAAEKKCIVVLCELTDCLCVSKFWAPDNHNCQRFMFLNFVLFCGEHSMYYILHSCDRLSMCTYKLQGVVVYITMYNGVHNVTCPCPEGQQNSESKYIKYFIKTFNITYPIKTDTKEY